VRASNRTRGKAHEKAIAQRLGGIRIGLLGGEDVHLDSPWSIECKHRKAFVACEWMDQATRNAPKGKTPIVIVHVAGSRHDKDLVIISLKEWEEWYGKLK
jgi:hypothetical protein